MASYECEAELCSNFIPNIKNSLKIFQMNIRSINSNYDGLQVLLKRISLHLDIIVLTECWLKNVNHIPTLTGYTTHCTKDLINRSDGVILYIKNELKCTISFPNLLDASSIMCNLNDKLCLIAIYRSPSFKQIDRFLNSFNTVLANSVHYKSLIVVGDININISHLSTDNRSHEYLNLISCHGLLPTHIFPTHNKTCIDHVLLKTQFKNTTLVLDASVTDHSPVIVNLEMTIPRQYVSKNLQVIDYISVKKSIDAQDFTKIADLQDPNHAANQLVDTLSNIIKSNTNTVHTTQRKAIIKPWITPGLLRCIKHRDRLHKKHKQSPDNNILKITYYRYKNFCNNLLKRLKRNYERLEFEKTKNNTKGTWQVIKKVANITPTLTPPIELLQIQSDPQTSLNLVNKYFVEVGSKLATQILSNPSFSTVNYSDDYISPVSSFGMLPVDQKEIETIIMSLKSSSAVGWDGIPSKVLKTSCTTLAPIITKICNLCISKGIFPNCFKKALVMPVFKGGDRSSVNNYRPISMLTTLSKIFEKVLNKRLVSYLETQKLLSPNQYGFRKGKSTEDAAFDLTETITRSLDQRLKCVGIFLDLSKAFDTVSIPILLDKLDKVGIRGITLDIFKDYLSNRSQQIKVNEHLSDDMPLTYGVPQGSILGPTLFLLYINNLCRLNIPNCKIIAYADDTVLLITGNTWENAFKNAEYALKKVSNWLTTNLLSLNVTKTKFLTFSPSATSQPSADRCIVKAHICTSFDNSSNCTCPPVEYATNIKYLGLLIDNTLSWKLHISNLTSKIRKLIYIFKNLRSSADKSTIFMVYYAIVQSLLMYCISVWGGSNKTAMLQLERAQRSILKVMTKRPFRFPTIDLYKDCKVLTVRQMFIFQMIIRKHISVSYDKNLVKRRMDLIFQTERHKSRLAGRQYYIISSSLYNKVNKALNIYPLNKKECKKRVKEWLLTLTYVDSEKLLDVLS